jgi:5-methylcytosine-specific restriction endonuclease McrA
MARDFAEPFYNSPAWKKCRKAYAKSVRNLCERCLAKGIYKPGVIVHHKVWLTPENIYNPAVTLNWDNLELLCRDCHAAEHDAKQRRYSCDELGRIAPRG